MPSPWLRRGVLREIDSWQRLVALVVLVLEVFLLAVIYASGAAWYVVLIGVLPLMLIIYGVFFGRRRIPRTFNPAMAGNIETMRELLSRAKFSPHLIIGLSRGGLVAAARLSHVLLPSPQIPTISLWPHLQDYDNALNSFNMREIYNEQRSTSVLDGRTSWNILIIDDASNTGRTLRDAKAFIEGKVAGIRHDIRTAALEIVRGKNEPDFFVRSEPNAKDAWNADE